MNDTATQQGAAPSQQQHVDPDVKPGEVVTQPNPRNAALEAMAERQEQARLDEIQEAIEGDPDLAAQQQRINNAIVDANAEAGIVHDDNLPPAGADGAASRQPMHEPEPDGSDLPSNLQDDPMADFITMQNDQPMVKLKVNGQDTLIPLADAKRQLQIGTAAEVRMQAAATREKALDERENKLTAGEAALSARMTVAASQPATPAQPQKGLSDEELEAEATEIFETAFSGTEEDAAKKLAKTLVKIRDSAASRPTQQINTGEIARQAATMAVGTITAQSRKKSQSEGYSDFKKNYPEILADPHLFKMADELTETVEQEHPDWDIAQVMDEAGKRTRDWVKGLRGDTDTGDTPPPKTPGDGQNSQISEETTQNRQERKAGLVRMPNPAAGAQHAKQEVETSDEQSPQEALAELRKARGQPY